MGDSFNLLTEKWIPIIRNDGTVGKVGILDALAEADRIRQIAASNPMDRVAILRFLLALLYWGKGNQGGVEKDGFPCEPPKDLLSMLTVNRDCFNLLGDGPRFYQERNARRPRAVTDLIQEIPTGNNFWHFRHSTDAVAGLCPACCALGLLRLPLFSVSGLPDLKAGINGPPPIYVVPWGASLLETLRANWLPVTDLGEPAWMNPSVRPEWDRDVPLLTGLTLLSRRVWLHEPAEPAGRCICCAENAPALIRTCNFQSAGEQRNDRWNDPHVVYASEAPRKASKAADLTRSGKFTMDRPWPRLLASIIETGKFAAARGPMQLLVVGFATDKAKNIDVWERMFHIPPTESMPGITVALLQQWQKGGAGMAYKLRPPSDQSTRREHPEIPALLSAVRPHVEEQVSSSVEKTLSGGEKTWQQAAKEYAPMMAAAARSLSPGFTASAVERRRRIASAQPDMHLENEDQKERGRKKGGQT
jgi:CRISPR type I-E-associated protein CasA/Cse1